ncbi:hypothetical protein [Oceanimonas marisflavi]|uniref:hypothetical protein n=1 Tax=Oceanimonas marisflavi TaxID=2059724 RepID=UPI000D30DBCA|nr:hypothetical protein [Oceanimonas marisflavi]
MLIALLLFAPVLIFLLSLPASGRLRPCLRLIYRLVGGILVVGGNGASIYFAAYSGDQGGITAFYLQITVIISYALLSVLLLVVHRLWQ